MDHSAIVDLSPLLTLVAQGLIAVLAAIAAWAAAWVKKKANIESTSLLSQQIDQTVVQAIGYAQAHLMTLLGHADFAKVETRNAAVQIALGFVVAQAPAAVRTLGVSQQSLADLILAKMARLDPSLVLPGSAPLPLPDVAAVSAVSAAPVGAA